MQGRYDGITRKSTFWNMIAEGDFLTNLEIIRNQCSTRSELAYMQCCMIK